MLCRSVFTFFVVSQTMVSAGDLHFKKHVINAKADYSAAALIDVNQDGRVDVVCGGNWYESPDWKKHQAANVPRIGGRPDGFSHLEFDVNRDGRMDVITVNYRSRSIKWMEHPGMADEPWELHTVVEPGPMESGRLVDIDGDGQLDLLPNGRNFAAWWEFRWKDKREKGEPAWIRHELPMQAKGHGVGFGDIDGDGRGDIIGQGGWLKSPEDTRAGDWSWQPEFKIERGSVPMLVVDADEDGDNDIVWCSAHGFGLYWLENSETKSGKRAWIRHAIDTSWSQCHAPLWADMDGDGRCELIAGKRYMAHAGSDPGAYDPLVVYRYQFNPESKTWNRWAVSVGDRVGMGLDPKVGDMDGDGDLDLLACGRSGLYWLQNMGEGTSTAKLPSVSGQGIAEVRSRAEWGRRRAHIVDSIQKVHGMLPGCEERVSLRVSTQDQQVNKRYEVRKIRYWIDNDHQVSAQLFIPSSAKAGETGGIVCMFDPPAVKKASEIAGHLVGLGYVCIVPQQTASVNNKQLVDSVWQAMRAADVLQAIPDVHGERIGFVGDVCFGTLGLHVAAADQRFVAVATDVEQNMEVGGTKDAYSMAELIATVAPRSLRISLPAEMISSAERKKVAAVFSLSKASRKLSIVSPAEQYSSELIALGRWFRSNLPRK